MAQALKIEKRKAYVILTGGGYGMHGDGAEFWGIFPTRKPEVIDRLSETARAWTEERMVSRDELERIKDDEVTDDEWAEYRY